MKLLLCACVALLAGHHISADVSHLANNQYLPPMQIADHADTDVASYARSRTGFGASNDHAQYSSFFTPSGIEVKKSVPIASFTVQNTVPFQQTHSHPIAAHAETQAQRYNAGGSYAHHQASQTAYNINDASPQNVAHHSYAAPAATNAATAPLQYAEQVYAAPAPAPLQQVYTAPAQQSYAQPSLSRGISFERAYLPPALGPQSLSAPEPALQNPSAPIPNSRPNYPQPALTPLQTYSAPQPGNQEYFPPAPLPVQAAQTYATPAAAPQSHSAPAPVHEIYSAPAAPSQDILAPSRTPQSSSPPALPTQNYLPPTMQTHSQPDSIPVEHLEATPQISTLQIHSEAYTPQPAPIQQQQSYQSIPAESTHSQTVEQTSAGYQAQAPAPVPQFNNALPFPAPQQAILNSHSQTVTQTSTGYHAETTKSAAAALQHSAPVQQPYQTPISITHQSETVTQTSTGYAAEARAPAPAPVPIQPYHSSVAEQAPQIQQPIEGNAVQSQPQTIIQTVSGFQSETPALTSLQEQRQIAPVAAHITYQAEAAVPSHPQTVTQTSEGYSAAAPAHSAQVQQIHQQVTGDFSHGQTQTSAGDHVETAEPIPQHPSSIPSEGALLTQTVTQTASGYQAEVPQTLQLHHPAPVAQIQPANHAATSVSNAALQQTYTGHQAGSFVGSTFGSSVGNTLGSSTEISVGSGFGQTSTNQYHAQAPQEYVPPVLATPQNVGTISQSVAVSSSGVASEIRGQDVDTEYGSNGGYVYRKH